MKLDLLAITKLIDERIKRHESQNPLGHPPKSVQARHLVDGLGTLSSHGDPYHDPTYEKQSNKDENNGYAGLDAGGLVPEARIHGDIARDAEIVPAIEAEDPLDLAGIIKFAKELHLAKSTLTIDGNDEVTVPVTSWVYLTSAGASDTLVGIGAGTEGQIVFLTPTAGKDIILDHDGAVTAGKKLMINGEANVSLDQDHDLAIAIYDATATVWNVLVPGAGGGGTKIEDADSDTKVDVEEAGDEDKVRMDVAGTERFLLQDATPHLKLTGDQQITGNLGIRCVPSASAWCAIQPAGESLNNKIGVLILPTSGTLGTAAFTGVSGSPVAIIDSGAAAIIQGLTFNAGIGGGGGGATAIMRGIYNRFVVLNFDGTISEMVNYRARAPWIFADDASITVGRGIHIENQGGSNKIIDADSLKIDDITLNTGHRYLIETPYLRLVGGGNPPANESNLSLRLGAVLKHITEGIADSGGAGYRLLRVPN